MHHCAAAINSKGPDCELKVLLQVIKPGIKRGGAGIPAHNALLSTFEKTRETLADYGINSPIANKL